MSPRGSTGSWPWSHSPSARSSSRSTGGTHRACAAVGRRSRSSTARRWASSRRCSRQSVVVKSFGREDREQERFLEQSDKRCSGRLQVAALQGGFDISVGLVMAAGSAAALLIGVQQVRVGPTEPRQPAAGHRLPPADLQAAEDPQQEDRGPAVVARQRRARLRAPGRSAGGGRARGRAADGPGVRAAILLSRRLVRLRPGARRAPPRVVRGARRHARRDPRARPAPARPRWWAC